MAYKFRDKVRDPSQRVVLYEFVPPEVHTTHRANDRSAATLVSTLVGFSDVDAVYIPEVIGEMDRGSKIKRPLRTEARTFASYIRKHDPEREVLISESFPYMPKHCMEEWLIGTATRYKIGNIVAVGARHENPDLPGYSVQEALRFIHHLNESRTKIFTGAIAMDTRRSDGDQDEPVRMVRKTQSGAEFFITQLFYTPRGIIKLLQDYSDACGHNMIQPVRVFLGVSPISSRSTLKVIEDLMERPVEDDVKEYVFQRDSSCGNRSIELIEESLRRIFDYVYGNGVDVPLGLCIEHITDGNFRHAQELLHSIPELWKDYRPDTDIPYERR